MTELEKIVYTKEFIDKLAEGINPMDGTVIPADELITHTRILGCFKYVSGILGNVIKKEEAKQARRGKTRRKKFSITSDQLANFEYSETPITLSEFCFRLESLVDLSLVKRISRASMPKWLAYNGLLAQPKKGERHYAGGPTELGISLGVTQVQVTFEDKVYMKPALTLAGQKFVIDNMGAFLGFRSGRYTPEGGDFISDEDLDEEDDDE